MSEWKEYRLGNVGKIVTGKTPKTAITDNYGGNIPFLSPSDNMELKYVPITARHLTEKGLAEVKSCLIPENSVCVSCIGSDMGKSVITVRPIVTNQQINSIIPSSYFDTNFLYYILQNKKREIKFLGRNGTAVPILNKSAFSNLTILAPELDEQRSIASILSSLDSKIDNNRKICANLEAQAQALFKHWFIDFAPFKDGKFVESELGMIPEGWRVGTFGDVVEQITDKVKDRKDIKVLSPINSGELVLSDEYFTKQVYSKSIEKYILVKPLDFAYNPARINIGSIGMSEFDFDGCVSPVYVVFRCIPEYHFYIDMVRKGAYFKRNVNKLAIGGVRQTLRYEDLSRINLIIPPLSIIRDYNTFHYKIKESVKHLIQENLRLSTLRDTLLPKLMSGEIKV